MHMGWHSWHSLPNCTCVAPDAQAQQERIQQVRLELSGGRPLGELSAQPVQEPGRACALAPQLSSYIFCPIVIIWPI